MKGNKLNYSKISSAIVSILVEAFGKILILNDLQISAKFSVNTVTLMINMSCHVKV